MALPIINQLGIAVQNRNRYFERLQRCYDASKDASKVAEFLTRAHKVDEIFEKFEETIEIIETLNTQVEKKTDAVECSQAMAAFENLYYSIKSSQSAAKEHATQQAPINVGSNVKVKLPIINIPIFKGEISAFPAWKSLFDQLINSNQELSDIQKFSYLKGHISDAAANCIEHIAFVAANYPLAYQSLVERYGKKRVLANAYLSNIFKFHTLTSDNVKGLRNFLDIFHVNVESLKGLRVPDLGEFMLLQLGLRALDEQTRLDFEKENINTNFPTFDNLVKFVKDKCAILDLSYDNTLQNHKLQSSNRKTLITTNTHENNSSTSPNTTPPKESRSNLCSVCNSGNHRIASCPKFNKMDVRKRYNQVKELKLCFACLSSTHSISNCKSVYQCRFCRSNYHHSLLHQPPNQNQSSYSQSNLPNPNHNSVRMNQSHTPSTSSFGNIEPKPSLNTSLPVASQHQYVGSHSISHPYPSRSIVLLGTAVVQIRDKFGMWHSIRCILDSGSQISIISIRLAQQLKLTWKPSNMQVSGINSHHPFKAKGEMIFQLLPHRGMMKAETVPLNVQAVILPEIASNLSTRVSTDVLDQFSHLPLADLTYVNPHLDHTIDLLIGAEYYCKLLDQSSSVIVGNPSAVPSVLGWLLLGKCPAESHKNSYQTFFVTEDPITSQLQKFWQFEELPEYRPKDPEEEACEEHFLQTHQRDESGKYILRLPFKNLTPPNLGSNRVTALKRLNSLDKKLSNNEEYKRLYYENLKSYIEPEHMKVAAKNSEYLLVHHGVYKATSSTTKLRVVFDPNVASNTGKTLAKSLMVGPKLQKDISDLLILFRLKAVAMTCDIQAMYRCIGIHPDDRKFQHILWHNENSMELVEFELATVTFGLPPSPYQAQRVLKQLALDEGQIYPKAADVLLNEVYVDDLVTGASTVEEAIDLQADIISLLSRGGFSVRKWASSHPAVLSDMAEEFREKPVSFSEGGEESIKVLGMQWCPRTDSFFYHVVNDSSISTLTKRQILGFIAKIYDCNGYLGPVVVWMKIFLQSLWLDNLSWDTPLSYHLQEKWRLFTLELSLLNQIKISRHIDLENVISINLIGFCDASQAAYAAVVYLRTCNLAGEVKTYLLRAKTKVAPLKVLTINRLELCAALLLAKIIKSVKFLSENLVIENTYLFTDSCVVLSWLKTPPYLLKIYVANRVTQILELTDPNQWQHVTTDKNSADPASRGLMPSLLVNNGLWFKGPSFLKQPPEKWPKTLINVKEHVTELKPTTSLVANEEEVNSVIELIERFSSLSKFKRIVAYMLRFVNHCRGHYSLSRPFSAAEINNALEVIIRITQQVYLREELNAVKNGKAPPRYLKSLSPLINSAGILAVGGRLSNAPIPEGSKHPILLPSKCHLTKLLIEHYHQLTIHGGPKIVQSLLQRSYWIVGGRNCIRHTLSKCIKCIKMKPLFHQPMMADLPKSRFAQGRAFLNVGVDLAGPFSLKSGPRRNSPIVKAYFAIFVCMSVKAIHLELLSSLSTPCFIAALDRFIGRRGLPSAIYSDNGTNFQGAARHISETAEFLSKQEFADHLLQKEINWYFNPPSAPNFGGLWEAGVKSVKKHLKHILSDHHFSYEEFNTILIQIEAILNSRPICILGSNPNEGVDILTPGHFLVGAPVLSRPEIDIVDSYIPPLKRWLLITQSVQCFWNRWKSDYLNTLLQRTKWTTSSRNLQVNDVVIIKSNLYPPQEWPLGVVTQVSPGSDGIVRVATVRTTRGNELVRPASKLSILPVGELDY